MDEIHFAPLGNHGKPWLVGIYRRIKFQGFLGGAGFRPSTVGEANGHPAFVRCWYQLWAGCGYLCHGWDGCIFEGTNFGVAKLGVVTLAKDWDSSRKEPSSWFLPDLPVKPLLIPYPLWTLPLLGNTALKPNGCSRIVCQFSTTNKQDSAYVAISYLGCFWDIGILGLG